MKFMYLFVVSFPSLLVNDNSSGTEINAQTSIALVVNLFCLLYFVYSLSAVSHLSHTLILRAAPYLIYK